MVAEECGVIQWEQALWLRRKFAGRGVQSSLLLGLLCKIQCNFWSWGSVQTLHYHWASSPMSPSHLTLCHITALNV
jgi:hypothetical protein